MQGLELPLHVREGHFSYVGQQTKFLFEFFLRFFFFYFGNRCMDFRECFFWRIRYLLGSLESLRSRMVSICYHYLMDLSMCQSNAKHKLTSQSCKFTPGHSPVSQNTLDFKVSSIHLPGAFGGKKYEWHVGNHAVSHNFLSSYISPCATNKAVFSG